MKTTKAVENTGFFLFTTFKQVKNSNILFDDIWQDLIKKVLKKAEWVVNMEG
ncbi:MAG: hypothetical protein PHG41_06620 [Actinomycetota bacterium]|nr:hypothetical protein [Actinomycetota bacterium]